MSLTSDALGQVVDDVMESYVGVLADPAELPGPQTLALGASVQVSGTWTGFILVSCSEAFAAHAAARMFETSVAGLSADDIGDALGEITNMIGGSVKSLMPEPSSLSLPVVTFGSTRSVVPGATLVQELHRVRGSEPLHVAVLAPA